MTDRQRELAAVYIPNQRDPELAFGEYYVLDSAERIRKVQIRELLPHGEEMTYGVYEVSSGKRIDAGYGSEWIGFRKSKLYDNKEDCKEQTHFIYDDWEKLRRMQEEETKC